MFAGTAARRFTADFLMFLENPAQLSIDGGSAAVLFNKSVFALFGLLAPATGLLLLAALGGHLVQSRPNLSLERLRPDITKLSLVKGFKRLFGLDGAVNILKGVLKILLVGTAAVLAVWPDRARLATALDMTPAGVAGLALALVGKVLIASLIVLAALALADYIYQRQRFFARHRMTRQELKDEVKQSEGDPQVKARIRQIRLERSQRRMIAAIPHATLVIANPTHYAVALKYESGKMGAPVCVAKGVDHLALTIRKVAEEHGVPVVENPPLARALHAAVELDR